MYSTGTCTKLKRSILWDHRRENITALYSNHLIMARRLSFHGEEYLAISSNINVYLYIESHLKGANALSRDGFEKFKCGLVVNGHFGKCDCR